MTDFDPIDWTEDDRVFNAEVEATLKADNVCIRSRPYFSEPCLKGYDHIGPCDWLGPALERGTAPGHWQYSWSTSTQVNHTGKCQPAPTATSAPTLAAGDE